MPPAGGIPCSRARRKIAENGFSDPTSAENLKEITRAVSQIQTQGDRCKEITYKLLSFARKTDPTVREVQLNELVDEVTGLTSQKTRYANVHIATDLQPDLPPIQASPSEIQQVLVEKTLKPAKSELFRRFSTVMKWADRVRRLKVRTNADTPHDSRQAREFGAQGIGLCRTEHMFFGEGKIERLRFQLRPDPVQQEVDDLLDLVHRELVEDDDLVDAVQELRT